MLTLAFTISNMLKTKHFSEAADRPSTPTITFWREMELFKNAFQRKEFNNSGFSLN